MADLPPWLDIRPTDYLQALQMRRSNDLAERNAQASEMARQQALQQSRWENQQRNRLAQLQITARNQQAIEALRARQAYNNSALQIRQQAQAIADAKGQEAAKRYERDATERNRHNLEVEKAARDRLNKPTRPASVHEPGVGIWQYNDETGEWEQAVQFPSKPYSNRGSGPRLTVNKDGTRSISGPPDDPNVIAFQKELEAKNATPPPQPGLLSRIFGGGSAPTPATELGAPIGTMPAGHPAAPDVLSTLPAQAPQAPTYSPAIPSAGAMTNAPAFSEAADAFAPSYSPASVGAPTLNALQAPPAQTPLRFTDKSGKTYIYKGSAADPSKDQDPANWIQE